MITEKRKDWLEGVNELGDYSKRKHVNYRGGYSVLLSKVLSLESLNRGVYSHAILQRYPCFTLPACQAVAGIQPVLPFRGKINRVNTTKQA